MIIATSVDLAFRTSLVESKTLKTNIHICLTLFYSQMDYTFTVWDEVGANCSYFKLLSDASLYCNIVFL